MSIDKERRGLGYGKLILELAAAELFRTTTVRTINSFIKIENIKSIMAFEKAKYRRIGPVVVHGEQFGSLCKGKRRCTMKNLNMAMFVIAIKPW